MLSCFTLTTLAADYETSIPSYVPYSGGAFFEVDDTALGKVTVIFPVDFLDNTFGFDSGGTNIYNLTNSTINGYVVASNGTVYTARANRFTYVEYRASASTNTYTALSPKMNTLKCTNINFITDDPELFNDSYFNRDNFVLTVLCFLAVCECANVLISILRRGHKY